MSTSPFIPFRPQPVHRPTARTVWHDIFEGNWRVVKVFETDGLNIMARREPAADQALNERERDVARFTALGYSGKWIGYELDLSPSTVSTYLSQALEKLGLESATELALLAPLFDQDAPNDIDLRSYSVGTHDYAVLSLPPLALDAIDELSGAEREVVSLVIAGHTNKEIAERRDVSARTVANQLASVYRKFEVNSRTELAVAIATR